MRAAELRMIDGKNVLDLNDKELRSVRDDLDAHGFTVVSIASPILKCVLPGGGELDGRFTQDAFASRHTFADQDRLVERALCTAEFLRAPIVRVFSYWRTTAPETCFASVVAALEKLERAAHGTAARFCLENEHACNVATGAETAAALEALPQLSVVWDPANALVAGEEPFPQGYEKLPKGRIAHVHAKDCHMDNGTPVWGPLGTRHVRWKEQIAELVADGYTGYLSLETHWPGPAGDKLEASRICGWNLRGLAS